MSILKFLLSPLLNEHGYTTLPTASIASGKPVTTGIFANIKTALDSFNDGTGIADGTILNRHLFNSAIRYDDWAVRAAASYPSNWALVGGAATTSVVISDRNAQRLGAGTILQSNDMVRVAGGELIRVKFRLSYSGAGVPTGKTWGLWKLATGMWVSMGFTSGVANQIACTSTTDAGSVTTNVVAYTYAADTWYNFMIEADTTSTRFYVNNVLINTIPAASSASTTNLIPFMYDNGSYNMQVCQTMFSLG